MAAHRYWSLYCVDSYHASNIVIYEVSLRTSTGGTTVTTSSTPSYATSTYSGYPASNMVDNSTGNFWISANGQVTNQRIWFDCGTPVDLKEFAILPYSGQAPRNVYVEYSDNGTTWTKASADVILDNAASWQTIAVDSTPPDPSGPQKTTLVLTASSSTGWSNPVNIYTTASAYASYNQSGQGTNAYFRFNTNAASVIPAKAVLLGVETRLKAYTNTATPQPRVNMGPGPFGGTASVYYLTTTATTYTMGGPTNLNGAATLSDIGNGAIRHGNDGTGTAKIYVNSLVMDVYWKLPSGLNVLFFGGGL